MTFTSEDNSFTQQMIKQ
ncbi:MAG: hypothetical protein ACPG3Z_00110 [Saprospiraceae bacterium]